MTEKKGKEVHFFYFVTVDHSARSTANSSSITERERERERVVVGCWKVSKVIRLCEWGRKRVNHPDCPRTVKLLATGQKCDQEERADEDISHGGLLLSARAAVCHMLNFDLVCLQTGWLNEREWERSIQTHTLTVDTVDLGWQFKGY